MMPKHQIMAFNCMPVVQNPGGIHNIPMPNNMNSADLKKRKRDERLMKNREAANKSRERKKRNMELLTTQVSELEAKIQRLSNELSASTAENTTLKGQNEFLRGLLTQQSQPAQPAAAHFPASEPRVAMNTDIAAECKTESNVSESPASTATNAAGSVLFAVMLSVAFISNPWGAPTASAAGHGGRVLLSVSQLEDEGTALNEFAVTASHAASHHNVPQRIFESVIVNVLTLLVIGAVLLWVKSAAGGILFKRRAELWSTIQDLLPMHVKSA
jgi:hypothetical protein